MFAFQNIEIMFTLYLSIKLEDNVLLMDAYNKNMDEIFQKFTSFQELNKLERVVLETQCIYYCITILN